MMQSYKFVYVTCPSLQMDRELIRVQGVQNVEQLKATLCQSYFQLSDPNQSFFSRLVEVKLGLVVLDDDLQVPETSKENSLHVSYKEDKRPAVDSNPAPPSKRTRGEGLHESDSQKRERLQTAHPELKQLSTDVASEFATSIRKKFREDYVKASSEYRKVIPSERRDNELPSFPLYSKHCDSIRNPDAKQAFAWLVKYKGLKNIENAYAEVDNMTKLGVKSMKEFQDAKLFPLRDLGTYVAHHGSLVPEDKVKLDAVQRPEQPMSIEEEAAAVPVGLVAPAENKVNADSPRKAAENSRFRPNEDKCDELTLQAAIEAAEREQAHVTGVETAVVSPPRFS